MKQIKLTKEHQRKLLKMIIMLYPKLHKKGLSEGIKYYGSKMQAELNYCGFYITGNNNIQCSYPIDSRDDSFHKHLINSTHWFEFVLCELVPRLKSLGIQFELWYFTLDKRHCQYQGHPIDMIYNEYKKRFKK